MLPAVLSIKTSLKAAVSADIADGRNLETLNTTSLCRAPILRIRPQDGIEGKSCERKGAQSKSVNSVADGKGIATRVMSQLQSHEIRRVAESTVCRLNPAIYVLWSS
jgi:hypothetical protein